MYLDLKYSIKFWYVYNWKEQHYQIYQNKTRTQREKWNNIEKTIMKAMGKNEKKGKLKRIYLQIGKEEDRAKYMEVRIAVKKFCRKKEK